ncbi:MAG: cell division protein FtsW [Gammaproteobacteria bacterium SG8_30]|jgi:cell division protein FtsW|nr:MAG: cell division protein FtsW [Gammaproteobacteria bacterium SG8_30]
MRAAASLAYSRSAGRQPRLAVDPVIVAATLGLLLIGLAMVGSASIAIAERQAAEPLIFLERQLLSALAGIVLAAAMLAVPLSLWERTAPVMLAVGFALLVLVLIPGIGHEVNGSTRWIRIGPLNFQPSEAARVALLAYTCAYAVRFQEALSASWQGFFKPLAVLAVAACLLLLEPDFGAAVVLLATGITVLFLAGARWRDFLGIAVLGVAGVAALAITSDYRVRRLTAFMDPWADPYDAGFQLTQSLIAIGRGEWFGVGLGSSVQKLSYLPEAHTDFVFAVLAEEFGLVGVAFVLMLFLVLVLRSIRLSRLAAEAGLPFHACMAAAFGIWLGLQAFINIGVNMGLLPTKGLTLPFFSYGRSSLLVTLAWVGVLLRIHHEVMASGRAAAGGKDA